MHKHPSHTGMRTQACACVHLLMKTKTLFSKRFLFLIGMGYVNSQGENVSLIEFPSSGSASLARDHK